MHSLNEDANVLYSTGVFNLLPDNFSLTVDGGLREITRDGKSPSLSSTMGFAPL
ncbi:MAG: hypothetical protein KJO08_10305 [Gammaproteobacteria bacterium]|nr:hypothetical protein [Gammaproteobacteria bacterium]NNJ84646.1 hypothetical protein [Gammaproteobacteria bacterium]